MAGRSRADLGDEVRELASEAKVWSSALASLASSRRVLPDPGRLLYTVTTNDGPKVSRLVSVELDAPQVAHTLNPPDVPTLLVGRHRSADGSRIACTGRKLHDSGYGHYYLVDLTSPEPMSVDLADRLLPEEALLGSGFSPSGRQFFVDVGGPFDNFTGVIMVPLDPLADAVMISEPGEGGHYFKLLPPGD